MSDETWQDMTDKQIVFKTNKSGTVRRGVVVQDDRGALRVKVEPVRPFESIASVVTVPRADMINVVNPLDPDETSIEYTLIRRADGNFYLRELPVFQPPTMAAFDRRSFGLEDASLKGITKTDGGVIEMSFTHPLSTDVIITLHGVTEETVTEMLKRGAIGTVTDLCFVSKTTEPGPRIATDQSWGDGKVVFSRHWTIDCKKA